MAKWELKFDVTKYIGNEPDGAIIAETTYPVIIVTDTNFWRAISRATKEIKEMHAERVSILLIDHKRLDK